jgi:hypothetical protein
MSEDVVLNPGPPPPTEQPYDTEVWNTDPPPVAQMPYTIVIL